MSNFLDDFFQKQEEPFVEEFLFYHEYNNISEDYYCICEGNEDKICYLPKIKSLLKKNVKMYDVGGKDNVTGIFEQSDEKGYDLNRIIFIVDRDFDEPLNNPRIYELPVYSIENLFATSEVLEDFILSTIGVTNRQVVTKILRNFNDRATEFNQIIQSLNIGLYFTKKIFDNMEEKSSPYYQYRDIELPSIKDEDVTSSISISLLKIQTSEMLIHIVNKYSFIPKNEIEQLKATDFCISNASVKYKGKYQFYFFLSYLKNLINDLTLGKSKAHKRLLADKNYGCDIPEKDHILFNILSNYVQLPSCFDEYIMSFQQSTVEESIVS